MTRQGGSHSGSQTFWSLALLYPLKLRKTLKIAIHIDDISQNFMVLPLNVGKSYMHLLNHLKQVSSRRTIWCGGYNVTCDTCLHHGRTAGILASAPLYVLVSCKACPRSQYVMAGEPGSLPPKWETKMELLDLAFWLQPRTALAVASIWGVHEKRFQSVLPFQWNK